LCDNQLQCNRRRTDQVFASSNSKSAPVRAKSEAITQPQQQDNTGSTVAALSGGAAGVLALISMIMIARKLYSSRAEKSGAEM
jgi:hypothetical protein